MAISINYATRVIFVPQADLTPLGGSRYELDVDWFRLQLKDLEDDDAGMSAPDTHRHNTTVTLAGVTYARTVEIINGYTVEFENGTYTVNCVGANHNIGDVKVVNSVSLIINNSAGLQVVETPVSGLTPTESTALFSLEDYVRGGRQIDFTGNDALGWQRIQYDDLGTEIARYNLFDETGTRITGTVGDFLSARKMIAREVLI